MARRLILFETYTRQEIHDIFAPDTPFTPQSGTWGLLGIVPIPSRTGDFVLFVTFGKEQAGHKFDEWITEDGIINWQSQPHQRFTNRQIQQLIHHDPTRNTIHIFLRTEKTGPYTYLGRLAYYSHDPQRERPVWIQWKLLDWPIPQEVLDRMRLVLKPKEEASVALPVAGRGFDWHGVRYEIQLDHLYRKIRTALLDSAPDEASRFHDWYVELDGKHISPKWIFHLITGAEYSQFDEPTATSKLAQIGLQPKHVTSEIVLGMDCEKHQIKEQSMYKPKFYKAKTIQELVELLDYLIQLGEIQIERKTYPNYVLIDLLRSTFVFINPHSLIASPRLINLLPLEDIEDLLKQISLYWYWGASWPDFPEKAFNLPIEEKYPQLTLQYILTPKPEIIFEDKIWRPVFLYDYLKKVEDWEDWTFDLLYKFNRVYTEPKLFVHSTLPIQNLSGGLPELQLAVWKSAFYWIMIQLIILSDPQTGAIYDPRISLFLSNGWRDNSQVRLYLQDEYMGDLVDCLEPILARFHWIWVNRSGNPIQDNQAILELLRLFLKLDIAELGENGRVQFTEDYRRQLFESETKTFLQYKNSKEARDQLREKIKELSR